MPGGISVVPEQFRDCRAIPKAEVADPALEAARMPTGHEAHSAGLTGHSRGVEPGEPRAVFGETVDIGRFRIGMAVATEVAVAKVVSEDENDVRAAPRSEPKLSQAPTPGMLLSVVVSLG